MSSTACSTVASAWQAHPQPRLHCSGAPAARRRCPCGPVRGRRRPCNETAALTQGVAACSAGVLKGVLGCAGAGGMRAHRAPVQQPLLRLRRGTCSSEGLSSSPVASQHG